MIEIYVGLISFVYNYYGQNGCNLSYCKALCVPEARVKLTLNYIRELLIRRNSC